jgi:regulator of sigma E protease
MLTVIAFVVALGLLIAVHEYGHYRVAVGLRRQGAALFGRIRQALLRWQPRNQKHGQSTEFVIGMRFRSAVMSRCSTSARGWSRGAPASVL